MTQPLLLLITSPCWTLGCLHSPFDPASAGDIRESNRSQKVIEPLVACPVFQYDWALPSQPHYSLSSGVASHVGGKMSLVRQIYRVYKTPGLCLYEAPAPSLVQIGVKLFPVLFVFKCYLSIITVKQRCQTGLRKETARQKGEMIQLCTPSAGSGGALIKETEGTMRCRMADPP